MNVHMLMEELKKYDRNMTVGVQLRVVEDPEEFVSGKLTSCAKVQDIDGRATHVVLVCQGKRTGTRIERSAGG